MDNKNGSGFHEDYLQKKDSKGKWSNYWVVLDGRYLLFYESRSTEQVYGSIEIGVHTKCIVTKRKASSYPFMVCALHGRHLFKCQSGVQRHQWMIAIQKAAQHLQSSSSDVIETDQSTNKDTLLLHDVEENSNDDIDDVLPPNVVLVSSFPATSDSSSHPFRIQDRSNRSEVNSEKAKYVSQKPSTVLFPFARTSEDVSHKVPCSEKDELNMLNIRHSHASLRDVHSSGSTRDDFPRNRSFPSTPEKCGSQSSSSSSNLNLAAFHKSKSLNAIPSSDCLLASNMRFSRHMVNDNGDVGL